MKKILKRLRQTKLKNNCSPVDCDILKNNNSVLSNSLEINKKIILEGLEKPSDLFFRNINMNDVEACLIYITSLTDKNKINKFILEPILEYEHIENITLTELASITTAPKVIVLNKINEIYVELSSGQALLLLENEDECLVIDVVEEAYRSVSDPIVEQVVRGPRESFVESLDKNVALLRRKLKTPYFRILNKSIGKYTNTNISICYLKGIVKQSVVYELLERLDQIDIDGILETGYLEEYIEDALLSPFPTVGHTQRPDVVAAKLLEGRVAILCDGTPTVLTVPYFFIENFQSPDDYYIRPYYSSAIRVIRLLGFFFSITLPGLYVAIINFHPEFLPTELLLTIAEASKGIPFPKFVEVLLMGIIFEILKEAGLKIPTPMGQAVSIVGALVLGEAAVGAGLVGQPVIIVTALTAISSFVVFSIDEVLPILRLLFLIAGATLGFLGLSYVLLGLVIHVVAIRSFGVNYLFPIAPLDIFSLKDAFIRVPLWLMRNRPPALSDNKKRQKNVDKPNKVIMDD